MLEVRSVVNSFYRVLEKVIANKRLNKTTRFKNPKSGVHSGRLSWFRANPNPNP